MNLNSTINIILISLITLFFSCKKNSNQTQSNTIVRNDYRSKWVGKYLGVGSYTQPKIWHIWRDTSMFFEVKLTADTGSGLIIYNQYVTVDSLGSLNMDSENNNKNQYDVIVGNFLPAVNNDTLIIGFNSGSVGAPNTIELYAKKID